MTLDDKARRGLLWLASWSRTVLHDGRAPELREHLLRLQSDAQAVLDAHHDAQRRAELDRRGAERER